MGCSGSKQEKFPPQPQIHHASPPKPAPQILPNPPKPAQKEEEIQILYHGKSPKKSQLDELTDKNLSNQSLISLNPVSPINGVPKPDPPATEIKILEPKHLKIDLENTTNTSLEYSKEKPSKLGFESHPHEFDFSFIENEEKPKEENLEDELLKELKNLN